MKSKIGLIVLMMVAIIPLIIACSPAASEPASVAVEPTAEIEANMADEKTIFVGPELLDCVGVGPMKCMQVKEDPNGDYLLFYSSIEGFEFEPGYEYELRVQVETIPNPPADAPSLRYTLVEIVNKTPVEGKEGDSMKESDLNGTRWALLSYLNAEGVTTDALPEKEVTLEFNDGRIAGNAGCNNYFGGYTVDGANLTFSPLGSTMMACFPEEVMQQEAQFLAALQSGATYAIVDGQLQIANAGGEVVVTMVAVEPAGLTQTTWVASTVNNGRQAVTSLVEDTQITAVFSEDGKLTGSAGCNNYMTSYTVDGENITIEPPASTRKMCPGEGIMEQEAAYLNMLPQAATYTIMGDLLELRTASGALIASYRVGSAE